MEVQRPDNGLAEIVYAVRAMGVVSLAELVRAIGWDEVRLQRSLSTMCTAGLLVKVGSRYRMPDGRSERSKR